MLRKMKTGRPDNECYSVLWKAPNGNYQITGIKDNERDEFYDIYSPEDIIKLVKHLNIKENIRHESYQRITETFEKTLRQAEDRYLELWDKLEKAYDEKKDGNNPHNVGI